MYGTQKKNGAWLYIIKKLINIFVLSLKFIHFFEVSTKLHSFLINLMYSLIYNNIVQVTSWLVMMEVTEISLCPPVQVHLCPPPSAGPSVPHQHRSVCARQRRSVVTVNTVARKFCRSGGKIY